VIERTTGSHAAWPAERFSWSILEAPQWRRAGVLPSGMLPALEEDLPRAAEGLHAVAAPMGDGRLLVCAADESEIESLGEGILSLTPETLPAFAGAGVEPGALNLLVGVHEPRALRRARAKRHLLAAASVLLTSALLAAGLVRRERALESDAAAAREASAQLLRTLSPAGSPEAVALEVARQRRLSEAAARVRPAPDAALALASLLRAWPATVSSKPQSLAVSESGATISVAVDGDATPFLKALKAPQGWSLEEPRLNTADRVTRLTLQLRMAAGAVP
jgi:hypothetical protein